MAKGDKGKSSGGSDLGKRLAKMIPDGSSPPKSPKFHVALRRDANLGRFLREQGIFPSLYRRSPVDILIEISDLAASRIKALQPKRISKAGRKPKFSIKQELGMVLLVDQIMRENRCRVRKACRLAARHYYFSAYEDWLPPSYEEEWGESIRSIYRRWKEESAKSLGDLFSS